MSDNGEQQARKIMSGVEEFLELDIPGVAELKKVLKENRDATITILGISEKDKEQLDFGLAVYKAMKGISAKIEIQVGEIPKLSPEEELEIAEEYMRENSENQLIQLILARVKNGHTLKEPFTVATGLPDEDCKNITKIINIYLEHHKAGFRVNIIKNIPKEKI